MKDTSFRPSNVAGLIPCPLSHAHKARREWTTPLIDYGPDRRSAPGIYSCMSNGRQDLPRRTQMQSRLDIAKVAPGAYRAMAALESQVRNSSRLEPSLLELVKMRASQINGCAYCIDMHSKDARAAGETEQRLYALNA